MASAKNISGYPKIHNFSLDDKLGALASEADYMDMKLSLNDGPTKGSLSEVIGKKGEKSKEFYSKLDKEHNFNTWSALIRILQKEDQQKESVEKVTDGLLSYAKANHEVRIRLQHAMCNQNIDIACLYAMGELQELQGTRYLDAGAKDILQNAIAIIERLQLEKNSLKQQLEQLKLEVGKHEKKLQEIEDCLEKRDNQIQALNAYYEVVHNMYQKEQEQATKDREEFRKEIKKTEEQRDEYSKQLEESDKQRDYYSKELKESQRAMTEMMSEFRMLKTGHSSSKEEANLPVNIKQNRSVTIVSIPQTEIKKKIIRKNSKK